MGWGTCYIDPQGYRGWNTSRSSATSLRARSVKTFLVCTISMRRNVPLNRKRLKSSTALTVTVASRGIGAMRTNATSAVRPLPVHANFRWSIRTTESRQGRGAFVRLSSSDAATLFPLYFAENAILAVVFKGEK